MIDEAINTKSYVVDLDRDYTYSIGLDHGQMNIYDNLTINGNGHFLDALGKCRIFSIAGNNNVTLNNIVFRNGKQLTIKAKDINKFTDKILSIIDNEK